MKRLLLSVFAAAITAVFAVPAMATDFTFDGEYRMRGEWRNNPTFTEDEDAASFILQRIRLTANAQATDDTSVKVTLQDSRVWGAEQSGVLTGPTLTDAGDNHLDVHEAYVNVENLFDTPLSLRVGTQELNYGDQRLVGGFGWNNNGRSFDAIKLTYGSDAVDVDLFASKILENSDGTGPFLASGGSDDDQDFYGLYAMLKSIPNNTLDVYALYLRDASQPSLGGAWNYAEIWTVGARLDGDVSGLDYTIEFPYQFGTISDVLMIPGADVDVSAWALAAKAGYTLPTAMKIRVGAEFDYATGTDSGSTDLETFINLFPTNHGHYGIMDQHGWSNLLAWSLNASADVTEQLNLYLAYWNFSLAEEEDAWYGPAGSGGTGILILGNTEDSVGSEIDFVATYKYNSALTAQLGYAHYFTGDLIDQFSGTDDQDWAYLQLSAKF